MNILKAGRKIKALTIFFIDSVDKVKDNTSPDGQGEYIRIFDKEYRKYFQAVSKQVRFDWTNCYEDFRNEFGNAESE